MNKPLFSQSNLEMEYEDNLLSSQEEFTLNEDFAAKSDDTNNNLKKTVNGSTGRIISRKEKISSIKGFFIKKHTPNFGLIIEPDLIKIIIAKQDKKGLNFIDEIITVDFPGDLSFESDDFEDFIYVQLKKRISILPSYGWCGLSKEFIDGRYIEIPKFKQTRKMDEAVSWAYKKETGVLDHGKNTYLDYHIICDILRKNTEKTCVYAFSSPKILTDKIQNAFKRLNLKLRGITSLSFAGQTFLMNNLLEFPKKDPSGLCFVYIGKDTIELSVYVGKKLAFVRNVKFGLENMENMAHDLGYSSIGECFSNGHLSDIEFIANRIIKQITLTLKYFKEYINLNTNIDFIIFDCIHEILNTKFLNVIKGIAGSDCITLDSISKGITAKGENIPFHQFSLINTDEKTTPNLTFTYRHKNAHKLISRINNAAIILFTLSILLLAAAPGFLSIKRKEMINQKNALQTELKSFKRILTKAEIDTFLNKIEAEKKNIKAEILTFKTRAMLDEIMNLTPFLIGLSKINAKDEKIEISGYVFGKEYSQDPLLASYISALSSSPLFEKVTIKKRKDIQLGSKKVIRFAGDIELNKSEEDSGDKK